VTEFDFDHAFLTKTIYKQVLYRFTGLASSFLGFFPRPIKSPPRHKIWGTIPMRIRDVRFIQVFNLIKRYETLILSAQKEGLDVTMSQELLNEAKYALKLKKYETAVDYVKRAGSEIVKLKRQQEADESFKPENLEKKSKEDLRKMCIEYDLDSIGLRSTLIQRLNEHFEKEILPKKQAQEAAKEAAPPPSAPPAMETPPPLSNPAAADNDWPLPPAPVEGGPGISHAAPSAPTPPAIQSDTASVEQTVSAGPPGTNTVMANIENVAGSLNIGYSYLIEEERGENSFKIFSCLIRDKDFTGLCFTRTNPRKLREKFNLEDIQMMWLTDQDSEKETVVSPSLEGIIYIIEEFIDMGNKTILLIDGMEYLIGNNGFNPVLRFIRRLIDKISETETVLLITISPDTMDERELKLLEREMEPITG